MSHLYLNVEKNLKYYYHLKIIRLETLTMQAARVSNGGVTSANPPTPEQIFSLAFS